MWRTIALYKRLSSESVAIIVISVVLVVVSSVSRRRRIKVESQPSAVINESLIKEETPRRKPSESCYNSSHYREHYLSIRLCNKSLM